MSEDGSNGGALWNRVGTAYNGEPFELTGITLTTFDDEGPVTGQSVKWPYDHEYVKTVLANGSGSEADEG